MSNKRLSLSDIFDIEIILKDDKYYYELEFDGYVLNGFDDFPVRAVLKKGERILKEDVIR